MTPDDAVAAGALALFGEKYGDEVRVLAMGRSGKERRNYSVELCGGTHVRATGDIGIFRIVSESAVSSGVRRIEAMTGEGARQWLVAREEALKAAASVIRATPDEVPARLAALLDERKRLEKELAEARKALALGSGSGTGGAVTDETIAGVTFSGQVVEGLDSKELRPLLDAAKQRIVSGVAAVIAVNDGKASIAAAVTDDLTGSFSAVDLVRAGVEMLGGKGGGGRPDMAQGGGPDGSKAAEALAAVKAVLEAQTAA
jgi:alanyl-tRNA synthetase